MKGYCNRCESFTSDLDEVIFREDGEETLTRKLCPECMTRLYHWFKMECHCYGCDEE